MKKAFIIIVLSLCTFFAYLPLASASEPAQQAAAIVNINSASAEELASLPGIGPAIAERITAFRTEHGAFSSVEDLTQVKGVGAKTLEKIKDYIVVQ